MSELQVGTALALPLMSNDGKKLLAADIPITDEILNGLKRRSIESVAVANRDLIHLRAHKSKRSIPDVGEGCSKCFNVCAGCGQLLPLRKARPGEQATKWVCNGCGAIIPAVLDQTHSPSVFRNVRPGVFEFDRGKLACPPETVAETVRCLLERQNPRNVIEKRASQRAPLNIAVPAVPLDEHWHPCGEPVMMETYNISCGGIALLHTEAIPAKYLAVELPAPGNQCLQVVVEVLHRRVVRPFYEYGGRFITKAAELAV